MGMYTELILGCSLSEKTPRILIEALDWVINSKKKPKYENPKNYEEKIYNIVIKFNGVSLFCRC